MDVVSHAKSLETGAMPGWPLPQAGSDVARRLYGQGEVVTRAMTEWNRDFSNFVSRRLNRTSEAVARMTQCQSAPEILAIQAQWTQDAVADYIKEANRLMEVAPNFIGTLLGTVQTK